MPAGSGPGRTYRLNQRREVMYDWKLQLNLRNLFGGDELIPVAAQPDGRLAVFRIAAPLTWTLSSRRSF